MCRGKSLFRKLALAAAAVLSLSVAHAESIRIGVAGPLSGDLAPYGVPVRNAVELAAERINAAGGIGGRTIEVVSEDDLCEPNAANNVANKLVSEGVQFVVGHVCSGATKAALPVYQNANIPVISPSSTNPDLTLGGEHPNFFRTISHDLAQADLLVEFATEKLGIKSAAVVHDKQDYGKALADAVKENLEKEGVSVEVFEGITAGATDYSALVSKIKNAGVVDQSSAVFYCGYHPEASKIVTSARKEAIRAHFLSGDGVKDPSFLTAAGLFAVDYYVTAPADTSTIAEAIAVQEQYKRKFGAEVGVFSLGAYAAVEAIQAAVEKAGSTENDRIIAALKSLSVDTPLGTLSFDDRGDVIGSGFAVFQIRPDFVLAE
jgi:branched-chain amino acid transport system substrate-binding protein